MRCPLQGSERKSPVAVTFQAAAPCVRSMVNNPNSQYAIMAAATNGIRPYDAVESTLSKLIESLTILHGQLQEPQLQKAINDRLHDPSNLPDVTVAPLAAQAVDLLHNVEQMLQPAQLVLADHFLGMPNSPMGLTTEFTYSASRLC